MQITPRLTSIRAPQADPGDLLIVHDDTGSYVALAVKEPRDGELLVLFLGPPSAEAPETPVLTGFPPRSIATSFAKEYAVRLPVEPAAWINTEPQTGNCLVLSGDKIYIRALYGYVGQRVYVYISMVEGILLEDSSGRFARPTDRCTYVVKWDIMTLETVPRLILSLGTSA